MPKYTPEDRFSFVSNASSLDTETFGVVRFNAEVGISMPYDFDVTLVSDNAEVDLSEVLSSTARFTVHREKGGDVHYRGIIAQFDQLHRYGDYVFYRAHLVPKLWWLSLTHHNQVCLNRTVPQIVEIALKDAGLTALDFEFRLRGSYEPLEYVCQYNESHLDFVSRWLEREGIYYYFEQTEQGEKVIFTDTNIAHPDLPLGEQLRYVPPIGMAQPDEVEVVSGFICRQRQLPQRVYLKDHNYRRPSLGITGGAEVDRQGRGTDFLYGEHFATPEEGDRLARIRAEELNCRKREFVGESDIPFIAPGYTFSLLEHYRQDFRQRYLVTRITHEGNQVGHLVPSIREGLPEREQTIYYRNSFSAIPATVQYRPERDTPRPRIAGTLHAVIDAEGSGQYAELDDQGRYKVRLPFDEASDHQEGKASAWLRMMQPYANRKGGMQFPLTKGTEVLLTFIDGDPDRPVIAGAVANPETPSPVTSANQTESVIQTGGENKIRIEDRKGKERVIMESPTANSWVRIGAPNDPPNPLEVAEGAEIAGWSDTDGDWRLMSKGAPVGSKKAAAADDRTSVTYRVTKQIGVQAGEYQARGSDGTTEFPLGDTLNRGIDYTIDDETWQLKWPPSGTASYPVELTFVQTGTFDLSGPRTKDFPVSIRSYEATLDDGTTTHDLGATLKTSTTFSDGTRTWHLSAAPASDEEFPTELEFWREVTVRLDVKTSEKVVDQDLGAGIRLRSQDNIWLEAEGKYANYMAGLPTGELSGPEDLRSLINKMYSYADGFQPTGMKPYSGGFPDTADTDKKKWQHLVDNAQVTLAEGDTFNAQNGNIYDFGGYWNYNLGNSYEENHMQQAGVTLNDGELTNDKAARGGPLPGTILCSSIGNLDNDTWITKTIGGAEYDYKKDTKSLAVECSTREESHAHGKKTYEYVYGGRSEETKYTGQGRKVAHSWSEKGQSAEESYDPTTGALLSYEFKDHKHFTYEASIPTYPRLKISTCASAVLDTSISIAANQKIIVDFDASLNFKLSGGLGMDFQLFQKPFELKYNQTSGKFEYHGPGSKLDKEAALKAEKEEMVLGALTTHVYSEMFAMGKNTAEVTKTDVKMAMGYMFNL